VSEETGSAGWSGDLDAEVGLSTGLDFAALLGFESDQDDGGDSSSIDLADVVAGLGLDGGGLGAGFGAAEDLLEVGEDLNDG
jgi:hypothetical protein